MKLIAKRPVLYLGRMYPEGAALPANNPAMVAAWLRAGSAVDVSVLHVTKTVAAVSNLDAVPPVENVSNLNTAPPVEDVSSLDTSDEPQPGTQEPGEAEDTAAAETWEELMEHTKDELEAMVQERGLTAPRSATKALLVELLLQPPAEEDED